MLTKKNSKGLISALERYDSPLYEITIIPKIPDINVCQIGGYRWRFMYVCVTAASWVDV